MSRGNRFIIAEILSALLLFSSAGIAAENRISRPIESSDSIPLLGRLNPRARLGRDVGTMQPEARISGIRLVLAPSDVQRGDLERFLEEQRDPSSPDYQNWLTPDQYGERFGLSENDLGLISSWLQAEGFTIEERARARNWITFSGTAAQIARVFHTELHRVEIDESYGKVEHFANTAQPWIPAALTGVVSGIRGLDDFHPKPQLKRPVAHPEFDASNGYHYLGPGDLATIYDIQALYNAGFDGSGQKLVIAGQTDISLADLRAFRSQFNLTARDPQLVLFGSDPGANQDDQIEATLDVEWSGAVARNATIVYVYSRDVFESLQYAIDQSLGPVISVSYGGCELEGPPSFRTLAQQANAEGMTWVNAAGDSGAAGCDSGEAVATQGPAAGFPADIPEVTAVGGTEFNEAGATFWSSANGTGFQSALSWIPEKAWNDTALGLGLAAGGGGPSLIYTKPWWQAGTGVPNDNARDVPDISLAASGEHDGYLIYVRGQLIALGGTSASSPAFAAIVSILNEYLVAKGAISKPGLGNINPALYNLAQHTTGLFHDVTTGDNVVPCAAGSKGCLTGSFGYTSGPGYDLATGLGSVDAFNLVTKWTSLPPVAGTTMTLSTIPSTIAASATALLTATVTAVNGASTPVGSVTFAVGSTVLGSAILGSSGAMAEKSPTATATLTVKGSSLGSGTNSVMASYVASAAFSSSTSATTLSVTSTPTSTVVIASPAAIAPNASTVLTATVKQVSGLAIPLGTVAFAAGNTSLGTANLVTSASGAVAALTVNGTSLTAGSDTISASYIATGNFTGSSGSVTVTVAPSLAGTATTVTVNPANIAASGTTQITATVKAPAGIPAGTVTFSLGNKTLGTVPMLNATATLPVPGSSLSAGSNSIVASYGGNDSFTGSVSNPVTVTVAPIATTTVVTASGALIAQSSTTVLTATVKAASGSAAPTGSISFANGNALLGTAAVGVSGTAVMTVKGSSLAAGANVIVASYASTVNFANSSSSVTVTVIPNSTTTLAASATVKSTGTLVLTATVKAAGVGMTPTGSVTFAVGGKTLGAFALVGSGGSATATLALNAGSLAIGNNTISATWAGNAVLGGSTATVMVTVIPPS